MNEPPPYQVLCAFGVEDRPQRLRGGTGNSWRAGKSVFKPCHSAVEWRWLAVHLPRVVTGGFRLPLPLMSTDGCWVVDGWCAQQWVEGRHREAEQWPDLLAVDAHLHDALSALPEPKHLALREDRWSRADRMAWGERTLPDSPQLQVLLDLRRPLDLPAQLIHGDLTGNVLFTAQKPPAVIDVSSYWRPMNYATAILVADLVCWHGVDPDAVIKRVGQVAHFPQLLVRALLFRMVTDLLAGSTCLKGHAPGLALAARLHA
ncbi:MAG: phosphotransferase [Candidatus Latescibacterota bacterium]|nr:phosphotransferase [Candidatus Latescibacterota bacterium]